MLSHNHPRRNDRRSTSSIASRPYVWLVAVAVGFGGCNFDPPTQPLRVAVNPWPGYAFVYLAEERGYFREEGVSVRLLDLASLADARRVFEQGKADVLCCTLVEVLLMNDTAGLDPVRVISAADYSDGADMLLAGCNVTELAAIRGRRIGVEPESVDGLSVFLALSSVGLTLQDVTLVPLAQSEMRQAMLSGRVDAVQAYPPVAEDIERLEGVHRLWDSSESPGAILDVFAARAGTIGAREREIVALLRAYHRAQQFYREHPREAVSILARRCGLSERAFRRALEDIQLLSETELETHRIFAPQRGREITTEVAEGLVAIGMLQRLPRQTPFDARFFEQVAP